MMRAISLAAMVVCAHAIAADAEIASWYGEPQTVACGGWLNPADMTAAHRTLPCGSRVRVCRHDRCVVVRINDRGPAPRTHRDIDLSEAAARELGLIDAGVGHVDIEVLK